MDIVTVRPDLRMLITPPGRLFAEHEGKVILGPFSTDRDLARRSFRRLNGIELDVVCFGHGEPLTGTGTTALHEAAVASTVLDPFGG